MPLLDSPHTVRKLCFDIAHNSSQQIGVGLPTVAEVLWSDTVMNSSLTHEYVYEDAYHIANNSQKMSWKPRIIC